MGPRTNRLAGGVAALCGLGVVVGGCGGDDNTTTKSSAQPAPKTTKQTGPAGASLQLAADPSGKIAFDKKTLSAKAGNTTLQFENSSQVPHAVEVEGQGLEKETKTIQGGKASLALNLKPGKYEFYCPVDGHRQQGMEGTLTVK